MSPRTFMLAEAERRIEELEARNRELMVALKEIATAPDGWGRRALIALARAAIAEGETE